MMGDAPPMKRCFRCGELKSRDAFYRNKARYDGLDGLCKECRHRKYIAEKDAVRAQVRGRLEKNRERHLARTHSDEHRAKRRAYQARLRLAALSHYSGGDVRCACCGEKELVFLVLDHIEGDGKAHRSRLGTYGGGLMFYLTLRKEGYPPGLRVLCYNCNVA